MTMPQAAPGGEAGYATMARVLTAMFAISPPLDSRQVHQWHRRRTVNKAGDSFPEPVREVPDPKRGQARFYFSVPDVLAWYQAGPPDRHSNQHVQQWKEPGNIRTP